MTSPDAPHLHVSVHLVQQPTVNFSASELWPLDREYARFGPDLDAFAMEVTRRLHADGYVGFRHDDGITVLPVDAVKRLDFSSDEGPAPT